MKIIILDTETTGLPADMNAPYTNTENWPHMVSVAWEMYTPESRKNAGFIVKLREGVTNNAAHINGITEKMQKVGAPIEQILDLLYRDIEESDILVAHNVEFDRNIIGAELHRYGFKMPERRWICTKEDIGNLLNLPPTPAQRKYRPEIEYKQPKLDELYQFLFNEPVPGRHEFHGAAQDAAACARCFWELVKRKVIEI